MSRPPGRARSGSVLVAAGIFLSRVAGLVRELVAARVLGRGAAADAFAVALRIPNVLQNLLGEGVLSASFVPVYSGLLEEEDDGVEAGQVAGAVAAGLTLVTGIAVVILVTLARPITAVLAFGLSGERYELAVSLTRIMALGVGFLVMSAWCLGVLNSHRRFFLSYVAPVVWNAAQIALLVVAAILSFDLDDAARAMAWGATLGGALQLAVQLPATRRLVRHLRFGLQWRHPGVREVGRRFGPAVLGRGVVQLSAYIDLILASMLAVGALAGLQKAQILFTLPVSLFAMSVAAAELPELSRLIDAPDELVWRAERGLRRVAFWMLLATVVFVAAGDLIVGVLFEGGEFGSADTVVVWFVLAAYAVGLPAIGVSRMLQNTCFALGDTRGPARIAAIRVAISVGIGLALMFSFDRVIVTATGLDGLSSLWRPRGPLDSSVRELADVARLGAVGLAIGSAIASWVELAMLSRLLERRMPGIETPRSVIRRIAPAAAFTFVTTALLKLVVGDIWTVLAAAIVCGWAVLAYTVTAHRSSVAESDMILRPVRRALWR